MRSLALVSLPLLLSCGGAAPPCPASPAESTSPVAPPTAAATTTATPPAAPDPTTPAPFTGAFDVVSMSDAKSSVALADVFKKGGAVAGRMTWELGKESFGIGLWQIASPQKDPDNANDQLFAFCRAQGVVPAHWEGMTLVLASTLEARGGSDAIRVSKKVQGPKTTTRTIDANATCAASFKGTKITFEVIDKDETGPTRLRAKAQDGVFELARGQEQSTISPKEIVKAL